MEAARTGVLTHSNPGLTALISPGRRSPMLPKICPSRPADLTESHVELIRRILGSVATIAEARALDPTAYPYLPTERWTDSMAIALVEHLRGEA